MYHKTGLKLLHIVKTRNSFNQIELKYCGDLIIELEYPELASHVGDAHNSALLILQLKTLIA